MASSYLELGQKVYQCLLALQQTLFVIIMQLLEIGEKVYQCLLTLQQTLFVIIMQLFEIGEKVVSMFVSTPTDSFCDMQLFEIGERVYQCFKTPGFGSTPSPHPLDATAKTLKW